MSLQAHSVKTTPIQRWFNVKTLNQSWIDVASICVPVWPAKRSSASSCETWQWNTYNHYTVVKQSKRLNDNLKPGHKKTTNRTTMAIFGWHKQYNKYTHHPFIASPILLNNRTLWERALVQDRHFGKGVSVGTVTDVYTDDVIAFTCNYCTVANSSSALPCPCLHLKEACEINLPFHPWFLMNHSIYQIGHIHYCQQGCS